MLGRTKLKFNEFRAVISEIEAILNDRPLTYVSSDLDEPQALTPSHLLYGDRLTSLPYDPSMEDELLDPTFWRETLSTPGNILPSSKDPELISKTLAKGILD
jgi:hypothetical protein